MTDTELRGGRRARRSTQSVLAVIAIELLSFSASAQNTDPATAQSLFDTAKALMKEERYAEACPRLLNSQRLDPTAGTAINLALCYEKNGQTASAWARYLETAEMAGRLGQTEREQYARERVQALEPILAYLRILSPSLPPTAVVQRDGVVLDRALLESYAPVDSGAHIIDVRADGKKPWSTVVTVPSGPVHFDVEIPQLEAETSGPGSATSSSDSSRRAAEQALRDEESAASARRTRRTWGFVALGAGVAGIGTGAFFGVRALSQKSDADAKCHGNQCEPGGPEAQNDAKTSATISTLALGVGIAAAGVGAYLLLTGSAKKTAARHASQSSRVTARLGFDGRSLTLEGAW